jgi:hypothetical protein
MLVGSQDCLFYFQLGLGKTSLLPFCSLTELSSSSFPMHLKKQTLSQGYMDIIVV